GETPTAEEELRLRNRQLENAVRQVEIQLQRYQQLFDFAPDGHLVTDLRGVIQEANRAASTLFAIPTEFLVGKPLPILMAPESRQDFYARLGRLNRLGEVAHDWEARLQPRKGPPLVAAVSMTVLLDREGR